MQDLNVQFGHLPVSVVVCAVQLLVMRGHFT